LACLPFSEAVFGQNTPTS